MHKSFKVNVQAAIWNSGKVLLLKSKDAWNLPGGRFEESDSNLEEALRREVREETGIYELDIQGLVRAFNTPNTVLLFYSASTQQNDIAISKEHESSGWFTLQECEQLKLEHQSLAEIIRASHR